MQQRRSEVEPRYSSTAGVDPYIDWAWSAGGAFFLLVDRGEEFLPVLIELEGISARDFADGKACGDESLSAWKASIRITSDYTEPPEGLEDAKHCTALVTRAFFEMLARDRKLKSFVARVALAPALHRETGARLAAAGGEEES